METIDKIREDIKTRIDIEFENISSQGDLFNSLDRDVVAAHIINQVKELYRFDLKLDDVHGRVEIFNEDKSGEGGIVHRFAMVSYPITLQHNSAAVFEMLRQTSTTEIELGKEHIAVFVGLAEDNVDEIDLQKVFDRASAFIMESNRLGEDVQLLIDQQFDEVRRRVEDMRSNMPVPNQPISGAGDQPLVS
ncbi:hypothetical protein [Sphingobacterium deserti]|uniref:Uncharacterized protein n=1 Tax=Sphingobacterium deserti TaxID=1229276 RepID=A0A0B8T4U7_9SPHI|nr:hypothetical protein [Sphingobacterium deserti]KGE12289.1 hypothetical protein DI53_3939 [Sphingobacterium deserti]